jgi:hypothetical protein
LYCSLRVRATAFAPNGADSLVSASSYFDSAWTRLSQQHRRPEHLRARVTMGRLNIYIYVVHHAALYLRLRCNSNIYETWIRRRVKQNKSPGSNEARANGSLAHLLHVPFIGAMLRLVSAVLSWNFDVPRIVTQPALAYCYSIVTYKFFIIWVTEIRYIVSAMGVTIYLNIPYAGLRPIGST